MKFKTLMHSKKATCIAIAGTRLIKIVMFKGLIMSWKVNFKNGKVNFKNGKVFRLNRAAAGKIRY